MDQKPQFELRHFSAINLFPSRNINSVKACLVTETEERIAILSDPNFDCLATNTAAGMLICSEPSLAIAQTRNSPNACWR